MTNAELIKALRYCGNFVDRVGCDEECPYFNDKDCPKRIMCDAADALEAAEKRIAELNTKCADRQSQINEMENEIEELLPKEGEWKEIVGEDGCVELYQCSECNALYGKEWNYCPNCGARMDGAE